MYYMYTCFFTGLVLLAFSVNLIMTNSPCKYQCKLETIQGKEICIACGRAIQDIRQWNVYSEEQKYISNVLSEYRLKKLAKI